MYSVEDKIHISPPVDPAAPFDPAGVSGKTILITGGASGFGAAFARHWAAHGAHLVIGDVNDAAGEALVAELRQATGSEHHHYLRCDVTDWPSQVALFRAAARWSPHGGIDAVVANAGIRDVDMDLDTPGDTRLDQPDPPAPDLKCLDVNITGVVYTAHLACFWLPRNPGSSDTLGGSGGGKRNRDRHLLLIGSVASLTPYCVQPQYTASKHAVLGLFRSLIGTAWRRGVRVNMLCPYFVATPILAPAAYFFLAGAKLPMVRDVVEAGTRFMAEDAIVGRVLAVGPRVRVKGAGTAAGEEEQFEVLDVNVDGQPIGRVQGGEEEEGAVISSWDAFGHDYDGTELFVLRFIGMLHRIEQIRGWWGWLLDVLAAFANLVTGQKVRNG